MRNPRSTFREPLSQTRQLLKETRPLGGATQYRYDAVGRLIEEEHTLPNGTRDQLSQYAYNKDGQLTGYEQTDGSNQLISSATYDLDEQGRTKTSTTTYGTIGTTDSVSFTTGQSFNADGQLDSHTYPDGSQQRYRYRNGHLSNITLPNQSEISYDSYKWVMPGQITVPGASKTLTYDALLRPTGITVTNQQTPGQTLAQRLYQYDTSGNISQIQSDLGITDYGYDKLDRLTEASPDTALQSLGLPQEQYGYDPVGNRTSSAHQPGFWRYNADNQLTEYPSLKPFSLGVLPVDTDVSYTPHGHTQKETNRLGTKEYGYNAAERLIRFANTLQGQTTPQLEAQYRYDPFGRRISKTITQSTQTSTVWFIYSEQGLMAEANEQGELTKAYGFNPTTGQQGLWSTDPIWQANIAEHQLTSEQTRYHYLHTDHLYTPMLATDATGEISWKAVQEAFGAVSVQQHQSRINMNLRFPGQYYDQETGTHYNFHRDYKPNTGRYVQSDPIGLMGGRNLYLYATDNSLVNFDPFGMFSYGDVMPMWNAYCSGVQSDIAVHIDSINWGRIGELIKMRVLSVVGGECSDRVELLNFDMGVGTEGADRYIIGRHVVRVSGEISVSCSCDWKFSGKFFSALGYDPYDFDSSNRGRIGETLTWVGRNRCPNQGRPFNIYIDGHKDVGFSGRIDGEGTCCLN